LARDFTEKGKIWVWEKLEGSILLYSIKFGIVARDRRTNASQEAAPLRMNALTGDTIPRG
jgi:hypothetical protein